MPKIASILEESKDRKELVATASEFAASDQPDDLRTLLRFLNSATFLLKLNSNEDYIALRARSLEVARVIRTLMRSPHGPSKHALVALTDAGGFIAFEALAELLILALTVVRPAPEKVVNFWDSHSQPDSDNVHLVIEALFKNGSPPAMQLFERKIADEGQEEESRTIWLRDPMLRHRHQLAVLECCSRMIVQATVPDDMRILALEALCDYDRDWYLSCEKPKPPPWAKATHRAKAVLRGICTFSLENLELGDELERAVNRTLEEIGSAADDDATVQLRPN